MIFHENQIIYQNIELQHTLIKRNNFNNLETGIDLIYFVDWGITAKNIYSFNISNLIIGYGLGLRIFISSVGVISIDIGYNPYGSSFIHPKDGNY